MRHVRREEDVWFTRDAPQAKPLELAVVPGRSHVEPESSPEAIIRELKLYRACGSAWVC